jgi:hypothetical protein
VIQRHVAQTLAGQIRGCRGALIRMGNVRHDLREGDSNERADGPPGGTAVGRLISLPEAPPATSRLDLDSICPRR